MQASCDIAIVGGGMVGASLALLCAKTNPAWNIQLIEPHPFVENNNDYQPSFDARSTALAAGSMELLSHMDVWHELSSHVTLISKVHVSDKSYFPGQLMPEKEKPLGAVIENAWLGRVLLKKVLKAKNITQITEKVIQCKPARGKTELILNNTGKKITCALAIIADGAESPLRTGMGISVEEKAYRQGAIIANVSFSESHNATAYERFTASGPLALLPLGESKNANQSALIWTLPTKASEGVMSLSDTEFLKRLQAHFGYRLGTFTAVSKRYRYPLSMRVASEQVRTGVALMGNAVHFLHPVAGQGFNLALRDCAALALELKKASLTNTPLGKLCVLQNYVKAQEYDQNLTAKIGDNLINFFGSQAFPIVALRHLGLLSLELLPPLREAFSRQVMGLSGKNVSAELAFNNGSAKSVSA